MIDQWNMSSDLAKKVVDYDEQQKEYISMILQKAMGGSKHKVDQINDLRYGIDYDEVDSKVIDYNFKKLKEEIDEKNKQNKENGNNFAYNAYNIEDYSVLDKENEVVQEYEKFTDNDVDIF